MINSALHNVADFKCIFKFKKSLPLKNKKDITKKVFRIKLRCANKEIDNKTSSVFILLIFFIWVWLKRSMNVVCKKRLMAFRNHWHWNYISRYLISLVEVEIKKLIVSVDLDLAKPQTKKILHCYIFRLSKWSDISMH